MEQQIDIKSFKEQITNIKEEARKGNVEYKEVKAYLSKVLKQNWATENNILKEEIKLARHSCKIKKTGSLVKHLLKIEDLLKE